MSRLLTVRATAARLGVHENTVRNWCDRGILHPRHLPGSRFRRFNPDEVEELIQKMETGEIRKYQRIEASNT